MVFTPQTLPTGNPNGGIIYLRVFCFQKKHLAFVSVFGKETTQDR
jgi:hypothetical protein